MVWPVAPPELSIPPQIERPCGLASLASGGDLAELEAAYMRRGQQIVACDAARALAVEILKQERKLRENTRR